MLNTILTGDCHELLKQIPSGSVNMVLCDPPYGTTQCEWDSVLDFGIIWPELKRICTPNAAIVMTASQPFTTDLIVSNRAMFKYEMIWDKALSTGFLDANRKPLKVHENILVFYSSLPTYNPQMWKHTPKYSRRSGNATQYGKHGDNVHVNPEGKRYPVSILHVSIGGMRSTTEHPTQKPLDLFGYLILTYTNPGDTVLDFTAGSGTTGVACKQHGRNYILIEREPKYVAIAERRISEVQPSLFQAAA